MALASAAGPTDVPLIDETIGENLEAMVARFPERDALVVPHQGVRYTYAEFNDAVDTVARGLLAGRLNVGDRIGIWSPNNAEWVLVQYATAKIGAILVNINPAYRTSELEYALNQSGCRSLISAHTHLSSDYVAMIDEVRPRVTALERVIYLESEDWQDLIEAAATVPMDALREVSASLSADQPINIQYTSGTTGFPKGATLSHTNILNNGFFTGEACGYDETDRVCIPVPFYHCFGMVMGNIACTTHGSTIVVPGAAFDPEAVLETVESEGCTSLYGVPTMFIGVLGHENFDDYDLTTLRTGIMAGSPCPAEVMKRVISDMHMDKVTIAYGMTETSPVSTQTGGDDDIERRVLTVGRVHPHVEIKIVNPESDRTVERGERGEFCTRGYSVMIGYWNESERTAEVIDAEGWMHTGDLATMDDEGYVKIVGRIKDMIIRGGENVYPREIEEFLYTHPDIVDAQVIGVPDQKFGEQVMAWVTLKPGATLTEEDVKEYCRGRIAHYKVPAYVAFVDEFPMTVTGKIQKFKLREMAVEELGLEEAASAGA
ncbi:MAG: AMP-binding protein [Actinomycetota bacterium]|nr:AMP-binding protein [Actinomycetota bacterium]MDK1291621.1 AMP-binding protein [Actinomycetota bacterium]